MAKCDVCGNDYPLSFEVIRSSGERAVFDSIECAAHRIAPSCAHCGCRILGHGIQDGERIFCCASCARHAGVDGAIDNTAQATKMKPKYGSRASDKIGKSIHEMKAGRLRSSSGTKVTSRKQAIAIGLSEARAAGGTLPPAARKKRSKKT